MNSSEPGKVQTLKTVFSALKSLQQQQSQETINSEIQRNTKILQSIANQETTDFVYLGILALCFYALGKIAQKYQYLEKAIRILKQGKLPKEIEILWSLQLAALYSSHKMHKEAAQLADKITSESRQILNKLRNSENQSIVSRVEDDLNDKNTEVPIWFYNKNHHLAKSRQRNQEIQQEGHSSNQLREKYYLDSSFQIADIMAMEIPPLEEFQAETKILIDFQESDFKGNEQIARNTVQKMVLFISIGCFTRATENYYQKNYAQKYYHVKAIKIARKIAGISSNYVEFLLTTLADHYGKYLKQIEEVEENSLIIPNELRRAMPKDTKEISLKNLKFAD